MRYSITILITFFLISCKLKNTQENKDVTSEIPLVKKVQNYCGDNGDYIVESEYTYDEKKRIKQSSFINFKNNTNGEIEKIYSQTNKPNVYTYYSDSIVIYMNDTWERLILDDNNLFVKSESPNSFSETKEITNRIKQTYDNDGYMIKKIVFNDYITYFDERVYEYKYANGNLIKEIVTQNHNGSKNSYFIEYEYYEDKLNTLGNLSFGKAFLGKSSRNLIKRTNGSRNYITDYKYEFDSLGNVSKMKLLNNDKIIETFIYQYYN